MLYRAVVLQPAVTSEEKIGRYVHLAELLETAQRLSRHRSPVADPVLARDLIQEVTRDLAVAEASVRDVARSSEAFRRMFGISARAKDVSMLLRWFRTELKKEMHEPA